MTALDDALKVLASQRAEIDGHVIFDGTRLATEASKELANLRGDLEDYRLAATAEAQLFDGKAEQVARLRVERDAARAKLVELERRLRVTEQAAHDVLAVAPMGLHLDVSDESWHRKLRRLRDVLKGGGRRWGFELTLTFRVSSRTTWRFIASKAAPIPAQRTCTGSPRTARRGPPSATSTATAG